MVTNEEYLAYWDSVMRTFNIFLNKAGSLIHCIGQRVRKMLGKEDEGTALIMEWPWISKTTD